LVQEHNGKNEYLSENNKDLMIDLLLKSKLEDIELLASKLDFEKAESVDYINLFNKEVVAKAGTGK